MGIRSIRKTDNGNRPEPPMITQDMLFELLRLRTKNKRLDELRKEIHALLEPTVYRHLIVVERRRK